MKRLFPVLLGALFFTAVTSHAAVISYRTSLSGANEEPPNASPGSGSAIVTVNDVLRTMRVQIEFQDLTGTTTASHVHCCTLNPFSGVVGVATQLPTFSGFPLGVTSGVYDATFDLTSASTFNPAFISANGGTVAGAELALLSGLASGRAYVNLHTTVYPPGEIRGFLRVPEPASVLLIAGGLIGLGYASRRKTR